MRAILLVLISLLQLHCTSMGQRSSGDRAVRIELKGEKGASSLTRYYSNARTLSYADQQLLRDKSEAVEFDVLTKVQSYDPGTKILKFSVKTVRKDGTVRLSDLAFPEKNEEIDYVVRSNGMVLQAGKFPPQTLYFVPSLPIPKDEVRVGDTWTMEHVWYSAAEGIPLRLDIVGILKDIVTCEGKKTCADIEISGSVKLAVPPTTQGGMFESRIWGRILFGVERGEVIWSDMRSQEEMKVRHEKVSVLSCMTSETKIGGKFVTPTECVPKAQPVEKIPQL